MTRPGILITHSCLVRWVSTNLACQGALSMLAWHCLAADRAQDHCSLMFAGELTFVLFRVALLAFSLHLPQLQPLSPSCKMCLKADMAVHWPHSCWLTCRCC